MAVSQLTVLVTRPAAQAREWVDRLTALGVPAQALPLIDIGGAPEPAAVRAAWQAMARAEEPLAVFVSPNAVAEFFAALRDPAEGSRASAPGWPPGAWAGATGPGTVAALREAGVPAARIASPPADAPQFDSEALWQVIGQGPWPGREAWIVRGNGGRDWLATQLAAAGASTHFVQAYQRAAPRWSETEQALHAAACAAPAQWLWLFSSSEAIDQLVALSPAQDWRGARALASHPRIAERARAAGFGHVDAVSAAVDAVAQAWAAAR